MTEKMLYDIEKHFSARLRSLLIDTIETCDIGGLNKGDVAMFLLAAMWYEIVLMSFAARFTEEDFVQAARVAYREMKKKHGHRRP